MISQKRFQTIMFKAVKYNFTNSNFDKIEPITSQKRFRKIIFKVAKYNFTSRGLEYLHAHCNPKITDCDLKVVNILLDLPNTITG